MHMKTKEHLEYLIRDCQKQIGENNDAIKQKQERIVELEGDNVMLKEKSASFSELLKHLS